MSWRDDFASWDSTAQMTVVGLTLGSVALVGAWVGAHLWGLAHNAAVEHHPIRLALHLVRGDYPGAGAWVGATLIAMFVIALAVWTAIMLRSGGRKRGDEAARLAGGRADISVLLEAQVRAKAKRLGVSVDAFGLPIARTVRGGRWLYSSWEDVCINISGPRTGKTTCWVVPRILDAPGAVVATSNKRDIVDETRTTRERRGRVFTFDPQSIVGAPQEFWWNPLTYVTSAVKAQALTQVFVDATRDPNAQGNAFFDEAALDLVAGLLMAAATSRRPLTELHRWLNNQSDHEPVDLLRASGCEMLAQSVEGTMNLVYETRSGVYGGASQIMSFLLNDEAMRWVTPRAGLPEFDPASFVASTDTLYCLSQEGRGSAAPIVTALTVAVVEAALDHAKNQVRGRLAVPMLIELDEAANVCRWRELPDLYSHFGSRGICVDTVLQSYSQGQAVWGEAGIRKLWSAANVKVYGGGVSERDFLSQLSDLIGQHWTDSRSISYSPQGRSISTNTESQARPIATVADLAAMPAGRAWVLASGAKPSLARLVPFWERKHATAK